MNFLKGLYNDFKSGTSSDKLGIISDVVSLIGVLIAIIVSNFAISFFLKVEIETLSDRIFGIGLVTFIVCIFIFIVYFLWSLRTVFTYPNKVVGFILFFGVFSFLTFFMFSFLLLLIQIAIRDLF